MEKNAPNLPVQLFEYDKRVWQYGSEFTFYDYNQPEELPSSLKTAYQIVVADPPYLLPILLIIVTEGYCTNSHPEGRVAKKGPCLLVTRMDQDIAHEIDGLSIKFLTCMPGTTMGDWREGKKASSAVINISRSWDRTKWEQGVVGGDRSGNRKRWDWMRAAAIYNPIFYPPSILKGLVEKCDMGRGAKTSWSYSIAQCMAHALLK
ncbi:unnamed protein product [Thlaspi arvense]|uniref:Uncharacterized protein n=1 Tax=Thlaspi arvense TaxID=13288 RepID=A0AAU9RGR2_THLAR|nr:unnamed protein product [Thlaspi arvense]